jgi:hypothetical protein
MAEKQETNSASGYACPAKSDKGICQEREKPCWVDELKDLKSLTTGEKAVMMVGMHELENMDPQAKEQVEVSALQTIGDAMQRVVEESGKATQGPT